MPQLIAAVELLKGQGRGGSVRRNIALGDADLELAGQTVDPDSPKPKTPPVAKPTVRANPNDTTQVIAYRHLDKRVNNPEVGMVLRPIEKCPTFRFQHSSMAARSRIKSREAQLKGHQGEEVSAPI